MNDHRLALMALLVFGSINMDLVVRTPRLPAPEETITGHEFFIAPGGKEINRSYWRYDVPLWKQQILSQLSVSKQSIPWQWVSRNSV